MIEICVLKIRALKRKPHFKYLLLFIVIILLIYYQRRDKIDLQNDVYDEVLLVDSLACHNSRKNDALQSITNISFLPPPKSIFFVDASCRGRLTLRQACVVESAARKHPDWQINVLFTSPVKQTILSSNSMTNLLSFKNVKLARINIMEYIEGTPFFDILKKARRSIDVLDVAKYMTMYKYSGVYVSLDILVARPFDELTGNWVVKESSESISSSIFSFSNDIPGRQLSRIALGDLVPENEPPVWTTDVMKSLQVFWCGNNNVQIMYLHNCRDLEVYETALFYPIKYYKSKDFYKSLDMNMLNPDWVFTYPMWERLSETGNSTNTFYAKLARRHCPTMFDMYGKAVVED